MGITAGKKRATRRARRLLPAIVTRGPARAFRLLGPGLVTGASDNDPSGIGTFTQIGAQFGYSALWLPILTTPLMVAVQELCARVALATGRGLGLALRRKYPNWMVGACVAALFGANTLNLGADLGAIGAAGQLLVGRWVPALALVLVAAGLILVLQLKGSYRLISSVFKWLTLALFAYIAAAALSHPHWLLAQRQTFAPSIIPSAAYLAAIVAGLGTTISPYLFFWQASSEVDRLREQHRLRRTLSSGASPREMREMRIDVVVGMVFSQLIAYFIVMAAASALHPHASTVDSAAQAAAALRPAAGSFATVIFAAGIIGTGFLAVPILSGSAAYALKEFRRWPGRIDDRPGVAPYFYAVIVIATVLGAAMNLLHFDTVRALYLTAIVNGLVAPVLLVMIVLLGRDAGIMGKAVSKRLSVVVGGAAALIMSCAAVALIATTVLQR